MSEGDQLTPSDFPQMAGMSSPSMSTTFAEPLIVGPAFHTAAPDLVSGNEIPIAPLPSPASGMLAMLTNGGEVRPLEELESEIIRFAISHYRGQMSEVARRLKIGRSTLYRKLDEEASDSTSGGTDPAG
jgi:DNA-binding NtrC family response regulator